MGYFGRLVGVGQTRQGMPCGVYAISARSEPNKRRRLTAEKDAENRAYKQHSTAEDSVVVKPVGKMTAAQAKQKENIFYTAMRAMHGLNGCVLISNGMQTDDIYDSMGLRGTGMGYKWANAASTVLSRLNELGAEHDGPQGVEQTPRIIGFAGVTGYSLLSMVTPYRRARLTEFVPRDLKPGEIQTISTYMGKSDELEIPDVQVQQAFEYLIKKLRLKGETPEQLTSELYEKVSSKFVVAAAATVYDPDSRIWKFSARNAR